MPLRSFTGVLAAVAAFAAVVLAGAASASSVGTREQIAWVRRAAANFVGAELGGDGARACSVLNAPLRATSHRETCAQRWDARLARAKSKPGVRAQLREDSRAMPDALVVVHGASASIGLPAPLMGGESRFIWSENCWMLEG
jgi:hypothetical protein